MDKISVVIPTLQKNIQVLNILVDELDSQNIVGEIIIIDNSLLGYSHSSNKVNVYIPNENLYVNPSWNYGVNKAKYQYIALLNDDILIANNILCEVLDYIKQNKKIGFIGVESKTVIDPEDHDYSQIPSCKSKIKFKRIKHIYDDKNFFWGTLIFFKKENYFEIPNELKIYSGDNYLLYMANKKHRKNYALYNTKIKHLHSLSSSSPEYSVIKYNDRQFFAKIDPHYKKFLSHEINANFYNNFGEKIFSLKNDNIHKVITICGLKFKFKSKKLIRKQQIF